MCREGRAQALVDELGGEVVSNREAAERIQELYLAGRKDEAVAAVHDRAPRYEDTDWAQIAALYGEKYLQNPQVSVFVKEFASQRVTLIASTEGGTEPGVILAVIDPADVPTMTSAVRGSHRRSSIDRSLDSQKSGGF